MPTYIVKKFDGFVNGKCVEGSINGNMLRFVAM